MKVYCESLTNECAIVQKGLLHSRLDNSFRSPSVNVVQHLPLTTSELLSGTPFSKLAMRQSVDCESWRCGAEPAGGIEHSICQRQFGRSTIELHRRTRSIHTDDQRPTFLSRLPKHLSYEPSSASRFRREPGPPILIHLMIELVVDLG
jgi:hypothetical protein